MEETPFVPIELTDAELAAVSGGRGSVAASAAQSIRQDISVAQVGGNVGASGSGITTVVENFVAAATQVANNISTGNVSVTVSV